MDKKFKPKNQAFVLDPAKAEEFMKKNKNGGAKAAIEKFNSHHPKAGVQTPYKGSQRRGN